MLNIVFVVTLIVPCVLMYVGLSISFAYGVSLRKIIDMCKYYSSVHYCCRFKTFSTDEQNNILDMIYHFNDVLEDKYQISCEDYPEFIEFYKEYRSWLLEKYMNPDFCFSEFKSLFNLKEKGNQDVKTFTSIYGASSRELLFFAQTFQAFSMKALENKDSEKIVAHKMYLGSLQLLSFIYRHKCDRYIAYEKEIIGNLKSKRS